MEVLKDRSIKNYNYTSRYAPFPYYYNSEDLKYVYGITSWLNLKTEYTVHDVSDQDTLDSIAFKYYGRPDLYWVIADFNRIIDPWIKLHENYNFVLVPALNGISFNS
jgi:hypothetical protein